MNAEMIALWPASGAVLHIILVARMMRWSTDNLWLEVTTYLMLFPAAFAGPLVGLQIIADERFYRRLPRRTP